MPVIENSIGLTLDRILVATDFTKPSELALAYAKALAKRFSSKLTITHVVDLSAAVRSASAAVGFQIDDMRRTSAENMERSLTDLGTSGLRASGQTLESHNPAAAIVGLSQQLKVDLIVMGTNSRHGLNRVILGSCAEGVFRHATCPVLTVGPHARRPAENHFSFSKIVLATGLQHDAAEKAAMALAIGEDSSAKVYLCYTLDKPNGDITSTLEDQKKWEEALRKLAPQSVYESCGVESDVDYGDPADHILQLATRVGADLIILGARRSTNWLANLSTGVVGHVLAKSECPVMTVCTS